MAKRTTKIEGYAVSRPTGSGLRTDAVAITVKAEFRPGSSRAGTKQRTVCALADGDLVEIEYEDGLRVWLTEQEYRDRIRADGRRDATEPTSWRFPTRSRSAAPKRPRAGLRDGCSSRSRSSAWTSASETALEVAAPSKTRRKRRAAASRPGSVPLRHAGPGVRSRVVSRTEDDRARQGQGARRS